MRDHPNHGTVPMMAGMWGVKVSKCFSRKGKEKLQTNMDMYISRDMARVFQSLFQVGLSHAIRAALRQTFLAILRHPRAYTKDMNRYTHIKYFQPLYNI